MEALSLRISIVEQNVIKTMQFDPSTTVYDTCRIIRENLREKSSETKQDEPKDYGLFLYGDDPKKGVWLEPGRSLDYYLLRKGDTLDYKKKTRKIKIRMLDGSLKTLMVDDSQPVANLMVVICTKIGITNHDEYSLVREIFDEELENKPNLGTLTLKRKKDDKERDAKMEQLRKKLKTDDEVNWIDHSKTLREQGIDESEPLLLRRKFFFSDQNIDSRDPVQLNLLYVQARDAIIDGTHPVTQDKACEFAGIQSQIQFGDHSETKHKIGFLDLKEFLPQSYVKVKPIEKKIFAEHRKHCTLSELDAKVLYTKTARDLKTYGVTFFLVKEKLKGKNKLVPRLLGVTKDSVLRLDEKTKEILKTWPLTTVRRWAASPNTFTLDFGDYSDQYYSVQTTEGEQISQLIAGYIDIILKKKKAKDHYGIEGDEGSTMVEDSVSPLRATIVQQQTSKVGKVNTESVAKPAVMRAGANGAHTYGTGHMQGAQFTTVSGQADVAHTPSMQLHQTKVSNILSAPQRALISTISSGQRAIAAAEVDLETKAQIPELGSDPASQKWKQTTLDTNKQNVGSQIAAMNAATAEVVTLTSGPPDDVDHAAVGAAINTITTNLPEMTRGIRMIAALMDDESSGDRLLDATRKLCFAFSDFLKAAEPESKEPRQNLLSAAGRVGEASHYMLTTIEEEDESSREMQDLLLGLAKAVANTAAALVLKAKNVAAQCPDQEAHNEVISAATQCALATSQLVACAKVVAPTISSPACQQQLIVAAREVARSVEGIVQVCQLHCQDEHLLRELSHAAMEVTRALNNLLNHIKMGPRVRAQESVQEVAVDTILVATDRLSASTGNAAEMVKQARILAQATAQLIQAIKGEAEEQPNSDLQRRLLAAAKMLADATARMVEAAKACATQPYSTEHQIQLKQAAEDLRQATTVAAGGAMKKRALRNLENSAKHAAASSKQCIAAAHGATAHNTNRSTQEELIIDCREVDILISKIIESVKYLESEPQNRNAQSSLINTSQQFLQPGTRMLQSVKAVLPTISDQSSALQLSNTGKQTAQALSDLRTAVGKAQEMSGSHELDSAAEMILALKDELQSFKNAAEAFQLRPLPGDSAEVASQQLSNATKAVNSSVTQLVTAAMQGNENYTGMAARDTANSLKDMVYSVRSVTATTNDREVQRRVFTSATEVIFQSHKLVVESKRTLEDPQSLGQQRNLQDVAKDVSQSLNKCVSCLPGQKDVEEAIEYISNANSILDSGRFPHTNKPYSQLQSELDSAAANLNAASTDVVGSSNTPAQLASSSKRFGNAFNELLDVGIEIAGQTKDTEVQGQMVVSLKSVTLVSSKLLVVAKSVVSDPSTPNAKNQLASAARGVTDSINNLIDVCTSAAPGQKECDNAIRNIQAMRPILDNPAEPVCDSSYFECLDVVMENSKKLGDGMTGIANHAKKSEHEEFSEAVKSGSDAICGLVEAGAQAAYLIGVSDPSSTTGRYGLVDQTQFARASQAIQMACQNLATPNCTQQQVLSGASVIAKHTSALCNACRSASSRTANPVAKRQFVQSAKEVASATSELVAQIKALDQDYRPHNRENCAKATKPLIEAVDSLYQFASSPEFLSVPAKISTEAHASQEPITSAGKTIIESSCSMILAAKSLIVNPKDPPMWQKLANNSKTVSDSIKKLVASIRDKAPGQRECEEEIEKLRGFMRELDQASLAAIGQNLFPRRDNTLQGFTEQMESSAIEIGEKVELVKTAACGEAEKLGHTIRQMMNYFGPLVLGGIGASSNILNSKQQMSLIDQTKTICECCLQLISTSKDCGGNPRASHMHRDIAEAAESMKEGLRDLIGTLENLATGAGVVTGLVESISKSISQVDEPYHYHSNDASFVDYQTRMVNAAKEIARISQDMVTKSAMEVHLLGSLAADLSHQYSQLAKDAQGAAAATAHAEIATRISSSTRELGQCCIELVKAGGACQLAPGDNFAERDVADSAKHTSEKVSQLLAALQAGSRGTQACINAASTVSGIIGDLDTTIMFATAGTLHAENEDETFADHREHILKTAKALVEDTKTLVAGAASSQEQLAVAAQNAVATIVQLAEVVKLGAASLGANNPEAQVMLINAVKDVASALGDLIQATKAASGKNINDPAMLHLKDSAKVMVTNVTSLLKTVKAVEDEHTRGTRALESTIEAIAQEIRAFDSREKPKYKCTPEELVRATKPITLATAKAVAAGNSCKQDDVIVAANMGRKAVSDVLMTCKSAAYTAESKDLCTRTLEHGRETAVQYRELLQMVMHILSRPTTELKQNLTSVSRKIAHCVTELVSVAELVKASRHSECNHANLGYSHNGGSGGNWVDPDDPTVIAENELLGAASSIDAAAKKLEKLRPRRSVQEADENLNFDEMILEAAKSIAAASSALVKAASSAQRELIDSGKVSSRPQSSSDDGQWSEGLVSAARLVAVATHSLVEAAKSLVQGQSTEEKLISAAKQVASSTAQLLVACKVKADPDSQSTKRLQFAGNAVKRATDNLVTAARKAIQEDEERQLVLNKKMVGGIAQEINARTEVFRIERELQEARGRLAAIRKAKYQEKGSADESDIDGYGSGCESSGRYENSFDVSGLRTALDYETTPPKPPTFVTLPHLRPLSYETKSNDTYSIRPPSLESTPSKVYAPSIINSSPSTTDNFKSSPLSSFQKAESLFPHRAYFQNDNSMTDGVSQSSSFQQHHLQSSYENSTQNNCGSSTLERMLKESTKRTERTITMTTSSKAYHVEQS